MWFAPTDEEARMTRPIYATLLSLLTNLFQKRARFFGKANVRPTKSYFHSLVCDLMA